MVRQLNDPQTQSIAAERKVGRPEEGTGPSSPQRQMMTITELARILGISRTTCYELAQRRELPVRVVRVGRRLLVSKVEVHRFLEGIAPTAGT